MIMLYFLKKENGFILIMILIIMSVLMFLGSNFLNYSLTEYNIALNYSRNMQAYYAAEAGVDMAFALLGKDFSFNSNGNEEILSSNIGSGYYRVSLSEESPDGKRIITSDGYVHNARETIRVVVARPDNSESGVEIVEWVKPSI